MSRSLREEISSSLLVAAELVLKEDLGEEDVEQAMLEVGFALVWMRRLPGGREARDSLYDRLREELRKRESDEEANNDG